VALVMVQQAPLAPRGQQALLVQEQVTALQDQLVLLALREPQVLLELLEILDQQESHLLFLEHSIVLLIFFQSTQQVQETYLLLTGGLL
jgi:hypothetical protein